MSFTPINSSIGALFIQIATTNHYLQLGETIGFSSVISNSVFKFNINDISLCSGLILSSFLTNVYLKDLVPSLPSSNLNLSVLLLYSIAGLLVGIGTKLGSGCTSGHMIGGLSRLRLRSLVAVSTFSSVAIFLVKYLNLGKQLTDLPNYYLNPNDGNLSSIIYLLLLSSGILTYLVFPKLKVKDTRIWRLLYNFYDGFLFGLGLHVSGMVETTKTIGFLSILTPKQFDPSLIMIVLFTIIPNIFIWRKIKKPQLSEKFNCATNNSISNKFLIGNVLFGLGWGLLGVCPGPGFINTFHFKSGIWWLSSFLIGNFIASKMS